MWGGGVTLIVNNPIYKHNKLSLSLKYKHKGTSTKIYRSHEFLIQRIVNMLKIAIFQNFYFYHTRKK